MAKTEPWIFYGTISEFDKYVKSYQFGTFYAVNVKCPILSPVLRFYIIHFFYYIQQGVTYEINDRFS